MDKNKTATLSNGITIPKIGLGTWRIAPQNTQQAVTWALEIGYRHIDTAAYYGNEREVGLAIKKSGINREEIFVTTKLWNEDHNDPRGAFEESLNKLDLGYIDLYLIHWPVENLRNKTWKVLEKIYLSGKCKAIGVSNYTIDHLKELLHLCEIIPAVNQVEFSPFLFQKELLQFCQDHKIQLEAYSPLTRGAKLHYPKLVSIVKKYNKSAAQILIRWNMQHNVVVIPKSENKVRLVENFNVYDFSITQEDMQTLDNLNENFRVTWDPTDIP